MANGSHILGSADLKAFNGAVWQTANSLGCLQSGVLVFPIIPFVESFGRRFSQRERERPSASAVSGCLRPVSLRWAASGVRISRRFPPGDTHYGGG